MEFKKLTKEELNQINDLFPTYLFYETFPSGDRQYHCTHCNRSFLQSTAKRKRTWTSADSIRMNLRHNDFGAECPLCKATGTVKNIGKCKKRINLYQEKQVAVIHKISNNRVQIRAYYCDKSFRYCLMPNIDLTEKARYILTPGSAERYISRYYRDCSFEKSRDIGEPFHGNYFGGSAEYVMIGLDALQRTFLKYNMLEEYNQKYKDCGVSYLCRFSQYPAMEMLQKLGHYDVVRNLVAGGRKSHPYVNWNAKNPWDFFKMNKQQYNQFVQLGAKLSVLEFTSLWKKISGKYDLVVGMKMKTVFIDKWYYDNLKEVATRCGISACEAVQYILKGHDRHTYVDYLQMADILGYDLTVHNVAFPKNLKAAHDAAEEARQIQLEEKRQAERRAEERRAKETLTKYDKQYAFSDGEYVIIVPHTIDEIIREGRQQKHCVGGYASRHMSGKLAILFLRNKNETEKSLYTIEMHDKSCTQIQGYNNRTPLTDSAAAFYQEWYAWVKAGSRRQKDGTPIFKKQLMGGVKV